MGAPVELPPPSSPVALPRRVHLSRVRLRPTRGLEVRPFGEAVLTCHSVDVTGVTNGGYGRSGGASGGLSDLGSPSRPGSVGRRPWVNFGSKKRLCSKRGPGSNIHPLRRAWPSQGRCLVLGSVPDSTATLEVGPFAGGVFTCRRDFSERLFLWT